MARIVEYGRIYTSILNEQFYNVKVTIEGCPVERSVAGKVFV
jgi:hypothetical protein